MIAEQRGVDFCGDSTRSARRHLRRAQHKGVIWTTYNLGQELFHQSVDRNGISDTIAEHVQLKLSVHNA